MNGSQVIGLDSMGTKIYAIHGYFRGLTVGQRIPGLGYHKHIIEAFKKCDLKWCNASWKSILYTHMKNIIK